MEREQNGGEQEKRPRERTQHPERQHGELVGAMPELGRVCEVGFGGGQLVFAKASGDVQIGGDSFVCRHKF